MSLPVDPDERERWQIAFERCEQGTCCSANAKYHQPRCPRRAARLALGNSGVKTPLRDKITMDGGDEWAGPPGRTFWIALVLAVLVCAVGGPFWLVYG